ncbi:MAG: hypothetical protein KJO79_02675 [Verrucomicrobiae bacterium]|nr:hypothetical protein [Verrucomicrobiae bacterium]NNJ86059.1 hypothetical protein [Akkermansiaceae bacterium]
MKNTPTHTLSQPLRLIVRRVLAVLAVFVVIALPVGADEGGPDKGKDVVGKVKGTLFFGTNEDPSFLGDKAKPVHKESVKRLQRIEKIKYKYYRKLGHDLQPVYRSYENWLTPLKPSEEILLSYESRGRSSDGGLRLDLELWQHRRKVMKCDPVLYMGKPLLILGPKWRGGKLIIAVELIELSLKEE